MSSQSRIFVSKLSIQGKMSDELSYVFYEKLSRSHGGTTIFGIFSIKSSVEIYQALIKETVQHLLDFYHRTQEMPRSAMISGEELDETEFIFENAIQYTNEQVTQSLLDASSAGREQSIFDIKKVSFILGALSQDSLFLSTTGGDVSCSYIYPVFRKQGFSHYAIVDVIENSNDAQNPPRLFSNFISGKVAIAGGVLALCNQAFIDYISLEQIKHAMTNMPIHVVASYFQGLLGKINAKNDFSCLFINPHYNGPVTAVEKQHLTASNSSMHELISTERDTREILTPTVTQPFLHAVGTSALRIGSWIRIGIRWGIAAAGNIQKEMPRFFRILSCHYQKLEKLFRNAPQIKKNCLALCHTLSHTLRALLSSKRRALFLTTIRAFFRQALKSGMSIFRQKFLSLSRTSKIFLILALLFLFLFFQSIITAYSKNAHDKRTQEYNQLIRTIQLKSDLAEASIVYDSEEKARTILQEAEILLSNLPRTMPEYTSRTTQLRARIDDIRNKIQKTMPLSNFSVLAELQGKIPSIETLNFDMRDGTVVLFTSHALYTVDRRNGTVKEIDTQTKIPAIHCAELATGTILLVCTGDENRLFEINLNNQTVRQRALSFGAKEKRIDSFHLYGDRAYILDTSAGTLFRHAKAQDDYAEGVDWIREKYDLSHARDFAIDGTVFILNDNATITRFRAGRAVPFSLPSFEPPLGAISFLWTTAESDLLFIGEPAQKRIIVIDKESQTIKTQLVGEILSSMKTLRFDKKKKELLILTPTQLIRTPFEGK